MNQDKLINYFFPIFLQISILMFFFSYFPLDLILNPNPATGGDMGSHFWYLKILREQVWDQGIWGMRAWNPANLGGEPVFLHYFPLPYFFGAILSYMLPMGMAFNITTILGPLLLPLCVFIHCELIKLDRLTSSLCSVASLLILFDESFVMLGGNILSTLAGQFCFIISVNFLLIASGFFIRFFFIEKKKKNLILAIIFSACVSMSHAYLFITIPLLLLGILITKFSKKNFILLFLSGVAILALSSWQLLPMIESKKYTEALKFFFFMDEEIKKILTVPGILSLLFLVFSIFTLFLKRNSILAPYLVYLIGLIGYAFLFSSLELYPSRILAPFYYFSILVGFISLSQYKKVTFQIQSIIGVIFILGVFLFTNYNAVNTKSWAKWNYSGWEKKALFQKAKKLLTQIDGNLSDPRVLYEHHPVLNGAGTTRVFESLGLLANRATFESLFSEAHKFSPFAMLMQGYVSDKPSCVFGYKYKCDILNLEHFHHKFSFLGGQSVILVDKVAKSKFKDNQYFNKIAEVQPFEIWSLKNKTKMVNIINDNTYLFPKNFTESYYNFRDKQKSPSVDEIQGCNARVSVDFHGMDLHTDCPNKKHFLKYSYHPYLKSLNGEKLEKMYPFFIGISPKSNKTRIQFTGSFISKVTPYISIFTLFILIFILFRNKEFI